MRLPALVLFFLQLQMSKVSLSANVNGPEMPGKEHLHPPTALIRWMIGVGVYTPQLHHPSDGKTRRHVSNAGFPFRQQVSAPVTHSGGQLGVMHTLCEFPTPSWCVLWCPLPNK